VHEETDDSRIDGMKRDSQSSLMIWFSSDLLKRKLIKIFILSKCFDLKKKGKSDGKH
jgi:hypothetical protein